MTSVDADELYGLPLERFTPERNALARELRRAGRREEAAEVAALRKPSVSAWAVNQLVRTQGRAMAELFKAGDELRGAHDGLMKRRGDGSSLRAAIERERTAVDALAALARGLLTTDGHELSPAIIERVSETLHAAALDDDARVQVHDGRLERELRHIGLGVAASASAATPRTPRKPRAGRERRPSDESAAAERAERERIERERTEARAAARATEREARRRLERAERAASAASERRERAAQALEAAGAELSEAEAELDEAREQLEQAEAAVRDLGR